MKNKINKVFGKGAFAVSGNANNGVNVGAFYVNSNNALSSTNVNYGSQLSYRIQEKPLRHRTPQLLLEHKAIPISAGKELKALGSYSR